MRLDPNSGFLDLVDDGGCRQAGPAHRCPDVHWVGVLGPLAGRLAHRGSPGRHVSARDRRGHHRVAVAAPAWAQAAAQSARPDAKD